MIKNQSIGTRRTGCKDPLFLSSVVYNLLTCSGPLGESRGAQNIHTVQSRPTFAENPIGQTISTQGAGEDLRAAHGSNQNV